MVLDILGKLIHDSQNVCVCECFEDKKFMFGINAHTSTEKQSNQD